MISIIIPFYNNGEKIRVSLDSVLNQTYSDLQIICIDDGSSDGSSEILLEYQNHDRRIEVIQQENSGVSCARNLALSKVKGEYILFLDGDDWLEPNTCEMALERLINSNSDVAMWPYIREMNGNSLPKRIIKNEIIFNKHQVQSQLHRRMIGIIGKELRKPENADALCTVWGKLYKANLILNNNIKFFDIRKIGTYEDGLFNLDVFRYVKKAIYIPEYLYHYRRDDAESITNRYNSRLREQWSLLFHLMAQYIKKEQLGKEYKEALYNRIALSLIVLGINETQKKVSVIQQIKGIREIITEPLYINAIRRMDMEYLPVHWKVFFLCAKYKNAIGVYALILIIQKLRGR